MTGASTECGAGLNGLGVDSTDAQLGEPHSRRQREDDGRDGTGHLSNTEEHDDRNQVCQRRHRLHKVEDRFDDGRESLRLGRPDTQWDCQDKGQDDRNHH